MTSTDSPNTVSTPDARNGVADQLDRLPVGRVHHRVAIAVGLGLFFDMYEVFLSGSISTALTKDFSISGLQLSFLLGSVFVGMFVGSSVLGSLADRIGRRRAFLLNLAWYSVFSLLGAFAPNAGFLVVTRFLAGVGVGAENPVADSYLSEVMPKDRRGRLATWAYTTSFLAVPIVGFLALWLNPLAPLGISGWRYVMAFGAVGAVIALIIRRGLPESPRWLVERGRIQEAQAALATFAAGAGVRAEPIEVSTSERAQHLVHARSILAKPPFNRRLGMLFVFHIFQTFGYYGFGTLASLVLVSKGYDVTASLLYVALSYLGYPIGSLLSNPLMRRIERKYLIVGSLVALAASGLLFATSSIPALIIVFGFLTTVISNVFSNAYHIYQAEIFPTAARATAVGWAYSLSRLSSGALPFVLLPILAAAGATPMFLVVAAALTIVGVAIGTIGPRTMRRSVEEINPV